MTPCHEYQVELRAFLERGLSATISPAVFMGWATETEGIVAAIAFHNFHRESGTIEVSAFSDRRDWLNRQRLAEIFSYPFGQLGVRLCVARIAEDNRRARRIWRALGAREYIIPELRGPDLAECLYVLMRSEWASGKFTKESKHG